MLTALVPLCSIGTTDCRQIAESADQTPGAGRQVRQGGVRSQERAPNYQLVAAWSGFLLFIGAGAFVLGMAIHNETLAAQRQPQPEPIYYCATGEEIPLYEPCCDRKDQRDI
jgi:hypothetical protein